MLENEVPLVDEVLKPFIEDHITSPSAIQLSPMCQHQTAQSRMPLSFANRQNLGLLTIQVDTNHHVGIDEQPFVGGQVIGQRQGNCIAVSLDDFDVKITIARDPGLKASIETIDFRNHTQDAQKIALIKSHQPDKTSGPDNGFRNK